MNQMYLLEIFITFIEILIFKTDKKELCLYHLFTACNWEYSERSTENKNRLSRLDVLYAPFR